MVPVRRVKHSVALVIRGDDSALLVVRRPCDPADPLAGMWGLPAITLAEGEDERAAVVRAGQVKLGVQVRPGRKLGGKTARRDGYLLHLSDYEAAIVGGTPSVPQPGRSMTQYTGLRFTHDPGVLGEAAGQGSLCAQIFLEAIGRRCPPGRDHGAGPALP